MTVTHRVVVPHVKLMILLMIVLKGHPGKAPAALSMQQKNSVMFWHIAAVAAPVFGTHRTEHITTTPVIMHAQEEVAEVEVEVETQDVTGHVPQMRTAKVA